MIPTNRHDELLLRLRARAEARYEPRRPPANHAFSPEQREKMRIWIKRLRLRCGMTQEQFGAKFGVTRRTVIRWEKGAAPVRIIFDKLMAAGKEKNMEDLVT